MSWRFSRSSRRRRSAFSSTALAKRAAKMWKSLKASSRRNVAGSSHRKADSSTRSPSTSPSSVSTLPTSASAHYNLSHSPWPRTEPENINESNLKELA